MDESKILNYLHENYFPEDFTFRFAVSGGQIVMRTLKDPKISLDINPYCTISVMASQGRLIIMIERQRPQ